MMAAEEKAEERSMITYQTCKEGYIEAMEDSCPPEMAYDFFHTRTYHVNSKYTEVIYPGNDNNLIEYYYTQDASKLIWRTDESID